MLKEFAPNVVIPPSPKNSAWMNSATEIDMIAPQGPRTIAAIPTPTAWPVVPPGSGTLNIMITNAKAANTESDGINRALNCRLHRRTATYQNGIAPQYIAAQVEGLNVPSGMCIVNAGSRSR